MKAAKLEKHSRLLRLQVNLFIFGRTKYNDQKDRLPAERQVLHNRVGGRQL